MRTAESKILDRAAMRAERERLRQAGKRIVFTNGCFDLLHAGHVQYLAFAREQGDALIVGINSDNSVRRNKGPERPLVSEDERALMLASLEAVDYIVIFDEDEPVEMIGELIPDVLVKGEDWSHYVSGRDIVEKNGGEVVLAKFRPGRSTTDLIERIKGDKLRTTDHGPRTADQ